jgi:integrase
MSSRTSYRDELDLPEGLDLHSLPRSYATHLIDDGWDPMFVQRMGHEHASTTIDLHQPSGIASGVRPSAGRLIRVRREVGATALARSGWTSRAGQGDPHPEKVSSWRF